MYGLGFQVNGTCGSIISILYGREKKKTHTCMHMHTHIHTHTHIVVFFCAICANSLKLNKQKCRPMCRHVPWTEA